MLNQPMAVSYLTLSGHRISVVTIEVVQGMLHPGLLDFPVGELLSPALMGGA
jgi:hypothetical protein